LTAHWKRRTNGGSHREMEEGGPVGRIIALPIVAIAIAAGPVMVVGR
jgi:hypothetical protein